MLDNKIGTVDEVGNYNFTLFDTQYRIPRTDWRFLRQLRGKIAKSISDEGELDPFSEGYNELQDFVLSKVAYIDGDALMYLSDDFTIQNHFLTRNIEGFDGEAKILEGVDSIFKEALHHLSGNFISPAQKQSDHMNSNQGAGVSSEKTNTQTSLLKTLKK